MGINSYVERRSAMYCLYCEQEVPEGRPGPYCSDEHEWRHTREGDTFRLDPPVPLPYTIREEPRNPLNQFM